jgi:hypothetical protein
VITRVWVLIPASLPLDSLSAPTQKPVKRDRVTSIRKITSYPDNMSGIKNDFSGSGEIE